MLSYNNVLYLSSSETKIQTLVKKINKAIYFLPKIHRHEVHVNFTP